MQLMLVSIIGAGSDMVAGKANVARLAMRPGGFPYPNSYVCDQVPFLVHPFCI